MSCWNLITVVFINLYIFLLQIASYSLEISHTMCVRIAALFILSYYNYIILF